MDRAAHARRMLVGGVIGSVLLTLLFLLPWWRLHLAFLPILLVSFWLLGYAQYRWVWRSQPPAAQSDPALEALRLRLARGEISQAEYEKTLQTLRG